MNSKKGRDYILSNLLNNNKGAKKKLLDRGPQITPAAQFQLDDVSNPFTTRQELSTKKKKELQTEKKVTTVRVKKSTRHKLNALVSINKADNVDELIELLLNEYTDNNLLKEEKRQFDMIVDLYRSKD